MSALTVIYIPRSGIYRKSAVSVGDESAEAAFWKVTSEAGLTTSLPQIVMAPDGLRDVLTSTNEDGTKWSLWFVGVGLGDFCLAQVHESHAGGSADSSSVAGNSHGGWICGHTHLWDCSWRPHRAKLETK